MLLTKRKKKHMHTLLTTTVLEKSCNTPYVDPATMGNNMF